MIAGLAGVLYRVGFVVGFPLDLEPHRIRHAHSHLMYFGWVTPLLMALLARRLPELTLRKLRRPSSRLVAVACGAAIGLGIIAFVPFLLYGYELAEIGERHMPLSMIAAGLNVVPWYVFAVWYVVWTRGARRTVTLRLFDGAVLFLVLSSLGAWGLALLSISGTGTALLEASALHIFLDYFAEGWLLLGVLGLAHASAHPGAGRGPVWGTRLLLTGLPGVFLISLPSAMAPPTLSMVGAVGGVLVAAGALLHAHSLRRLRGIWRFVLVLIVVKAVGAGLYGLPGVGAWLEMQGLRVLYLHVLLLGVVSLGLLVASEEAWFAGALRGLRVMAWSVALLLASLVPLSGVWPAALGGAWVLAFAAIAAPVPVVAAGLLTVGALRRLRVRRPRVQMAAA